VATLERMLFQWITLTALMVQEPLTVKGPVYFWALAGVGVSPLVV